MQDSPRNRLPISPEPVGSHGGAEEQPVPRHSPPLLATGLAASGAVPVGRPGTGDHDHPTLALDRCYHGPQGLVKRISIR